MQSINGNRLIIIGAGGHGKVVAETVLLKSEYNLIGFVDESIEKGTLLFNNLSCLGNIQDVLSGLIGADYFLVAIGNNSIRKKIYEQLAPILKSAIVIHPSAVVSSSAIINGGTVILANSVINAETIVSENCVINTLSLVDHNSFIGGHTHITQGTIIGSNVIVPEQHIFSLGDRIPSFSKL